MPNNAERNIFVDPDVIKAKGGKNENNRTGRSARRERDSTVTRKFRFGYAGSTT
jgi:hypothetical protein